MAGIPLTQSGFSDYASFDADARPGTLSFQEFLGTQDTSYLNFVDPLSQVRSLMYTHLWGVVRLLPKAFQYSHAGVRYVLLSGC